MSDTPKTAPLSTDRRARFEADVERLALTDTGAGSDARNTRAAVAAMVAGLAIIAVTFVVSGSIDDSRDVMSAIILALFGLGVIIAGAALYLRYAMASFLRLWLLRLLAERRDETG